MAVRLDGQIRLHAEYYVNARRILRVNRQFLHAAHFGTSRIADGRTPLQLAREGKVSVIGLRSATKRSGDGKNHADQTNRSNPIKEPHENPVTLFRHHVLFSLLTLITNGGLGGPSAEKRLRPPLPARARDPEIGARGVACLRASPPSSPWRRYGLCRSAPCDLRSSTRSPIHA